MSDNDYESEEYNDDSVLMEIAVSRKYTSMTKIVFFNIAHADASAWFIETRDYVVEEAYNSVISFSLCVNLTHWCSIAWNRYLIAPYILDTLINRTVH